MAIQKKNTWDKLKNWFKSSILGQKTPQVQAAKISQSSLPKNAFTQQSKTASFIPAKTKVIDTTSQSIVPKTQVNTQVSKPVVPTKQERNINAAQSVVDEIDKERSNQSLFRKANRNIARALKIPNVLDLPSEIQKKTAQAQVIANKISPTLNDIFNKAQQKIAPIADQLDNPTYNNLSQVAENSSLPVKVGAFLGDFALSPLRAGVNGANLVQEADAATNSIKGDENLNDLLKYGGETLTATGDMLLMGKASQAKTLPAMLKYLLGRTGKAAATGAMTNAGVQGIENIAGSRKGFDLAEILKSGGNAAKNVGAYEATDTILDSALSLGSSLAKQYGAQNLSKVLTFLIEDNTLSYIGAQGGHFLTKEGLAAVTRMFGAGAARGLAEVPIESLVDPALNSQEGDTRGYGERVTEAIPQNIIGNVGFGGLARGIAPSLGKSLDIADTANKNKLYSGFRNLDWGSKEAQAYAKELDKNDQILKEAGQEPDLAKIENVKNESELNTVLQDGKTQIIDETQRDLQKPKTIKEIFNNVSKGDLGLYGKDIGNVGRGYFGGVSGKGMELANKASKELDQVGLLAQASNDIGVRRDARMVIYLLSNRVNDNTRVSKLIKLRNELESEGKPEGEIIINAIDKLTLGKDDSTTYTNYQEAFNSHPAGNKTVDYKDLQKPKTIKEVLAKNYATPRDSKKLNFIVNEDGTISPVNKMSWAETKEFRANQVPSKVESQTKLDENGKPVFDALPAPEEQLALPAGYKTVDYKGLQKILAKGGDTNYINLDAKSPNAVRFGLKAGLPLSKILQPENKIYESKGVFYADEDGKVFVNDKDMKSFQEALEADKNAQKYSVNPKELKDNTKLNPFQKLFGSANYVAQNAGREGRKMLLLHDKAAQYVDDFVGAAKAKLIPIVQKLSYQERKDVASYLTGEKQPETEAMTALVQAWKEIRVDAYNRAKEAGVPVATFLENYFPEYLKGFENKDEYNMAFGKDNIAHNTDIGNLTHERTKEGLDYDRSANALFKYIEGAYTTIARNIYYGAKNADLYDLARKSKNNADALSEVANVWTGVASDVGKVEKSIRAFSTMKLTPVTVLRNLGQIINTASATSWTNVAKTMLEIKKNPDQALKNALLANEISESDALTIRNDLDNGNFVGAYLKLIGFSKSENFNRKIAVNAGVKYAQDLLPQAKQGDERAIRELKRLGILDLDKDYSVEDLAVTAGKRLSELTQFRSSNGELPTWANKNAFTRLLVQMRTFAYKQTGFKLGNLGRIASEASKNNWRPLITELGTIGIASPIIGEVVNSAREIFFNRDRGDESKLKRYIDDILVVYSLGLLDMDTLESFAGKYGEKGVFTTAGGINAGLGWDAYVLGSNLRKGITEPSEKKSTLDNLLPDESKRILLRQVPLVGNTLANTFVDNAYIDNKFGGVNEGLSKEDKQTYRNLKDSGKDALAEDFKQKNQYAQTEEKTPNIFNLSKSKEINSEGLSLPDPTSQKEVSAFKKNVKNIISAELESKSDETILSKEQMSQYVFDGKTAESDDFDERDKVFDKLTSAMDDSEYTQAQKDAILEASGVLPDEWDYYQEASRNENARVQTIAKTIETLKDDKEIEDYLVSLRYKINGKLVATDTVVTALQRMGVISKSLAKALKKYDWSEINDDWLDSSSSESESWGSSKAGKKAKAANEGMNDLASILSSMAGKTSAGSPNQAINYSAYSGLSNLGSNKNSNATYQGSDLLEKILASTRQKQDKRYKTSL